jgi:deoxycytidylate deaminase
MDISKKDMRFINMALEISNKSNMLMKHGCIITCNNKYISSGYNSIRNRFNDNITKESYSCHAEMDALRKLIKIKSKQNKRTIIRNTRDNFRI